jgi:hypothetical protein
MNFDPTITLSGVAIFGSNVILGLIYLMRMEGKLNVVSSRLDSLETTVATLVKTDVRLATLEERLTNHVTMITTAQRDISDLRRGNGFITHPRDRVDGEYP